MRIFSRVCVCVCMCMFSCVSSCAPNPEMWAVYVYIYIYIHRSQNSSASSTHGAATQGVIAAQQLLQLTATRRGQLAIFESDTLADLLEWLKRRAKGHPNAATAAATAAASAAATAPAGRYSQKSHCSDFYTRN